MVRIKLTFRHGEKQTQSVIIGKPGCEMGFSTGNIKLIGVVSCGHVAKLNLWLQRDILVLDYAAKGAPLRQGVLSLTISSKSTVSNSMERTCCD